MLMHGNEALHAYLLVLSVVSAAIFSYRAYQTELSGWMVAASCCCIVATFCFGPGIATFPAVIVLGILLRVSYKQLAIVATVFIACLLVYLYALPSNDGVRGSLAFHPWKNFKFSMTWLSSPWAVGWLSLAEPPLYPYVVESFRDDTIGALLQKSADASVAVSHLNWRTLSMLIGIAGTGCFLARSLYIFITGRSVSLLRALATMLCLFALATALLVSVGRSDYFVTYPDQLFADRYLIWPSLFWCGLTLLILVDALESKARWPLPIYCAILLTLPIALLPTHSNSAGWAAAVYRNAQRLAAAARSAVIDPNAIEGNVDSVDQYNTTVAMFRERNLAMFADTSWQLLNSQWTGPLDRRDEIAVSVQAMTTVALSDTSAAAGRFEGLITAGIDRLPRNGDLIVLDDDNRIAGFAEFSYLGIGTRPLIFSVPRKRGFDGYVSVLDKRAHYRVAWLDPETDHVIFLAEIPSS